MPVADIRRIASGPVDEERSAPARILSGTPTQAVRNDFSDPSEQFFAGVWEATKGSWRVRYTENEFCLILAGRVTLTDDQGGSASFGVGDAFVVPVGFEGVWTVDEDARKYYVIFEPKASA